MNYREQLYHNALFAIEDIYRQSQYNKDVDLYRIYDIVNSTNEAQIKSKQWLVDNLAPFINRKYIAKDLTKILILGGWYGVTGILLREHVDPEVVIRSVDSDPICQIIGKDLIHNIPNCENNMFVTDDAADYFFDRGRWYQLIINTSCEHMNQEDLNLIIATKHKNSLVCFQSNNYHKEPEHINTHNSVEEFAESLNLTRVYWTGTLKPSEEYERYMVIGI